MKYLQIVKDEREYWEQYENSNNRLLRRVARMNLFSIKMRQYKFNRLTKTVSH
jgi:hypothetical protein